MNINRKDWSSPANRENINKKLESVVNMLRRRNSIRCALALGTATYISFGLTGCATVPEPSPSAAVAVAEGPKLNVQAVDAANARWKLLLKRDFGKAFEYFTEASKDGITPEFLAGYVDTIKAQNAEATNAECTDERCEVQLRLTVGIPVPRMSPRLVDIPLKETWLVEHGKIKLVRPVKR